MNDSDAVERNRRSWNAATRAHNAAKRDQAAFLREGGTTLFDEEVELLGDVRGVRVAHLQCNSGQDSLGLARLGADVTGVDVSDDAIAFARRLSDDTGIAARFERNDLFAWFDDACAGSFDVAFSSYGVLCWLADLGRWAQGVAKILAPGGRLVLVEFHPTTQMFDEDLTPRFPYFAAAGPVEVAEGVGDYVADSGEGLAPSGTGDRSEPFRNPEACVEYPWGVGDLLDATRRAGLAIEVYREYPYSNGWKPFECAVSGDDRRFTMPADRPALPLMLGLVAHKPVG